MRIRELLRAIAAFVVFSAGIALFLVSIIGVIAALSKTPLFALVGFAGMAIASILLHIANTRIAPHHFLSPVPSKWAQHG